MNHLLKLLDCTSEEIVSILDLADQLKYEKKHGIAHRHLEGKSIGLIFQKSSTRTKFSVQGVQTRLKRNDRFEISDRVVN